MGGGNQKEDGMGKCSKEHRLRATVVAVEEDGFGPVGCLV